MAECARRIMKQNGLADKIKLVPKRSTEITVGPGGYMCVVSSDMFDLYASCSISQKTAMADSHYFFKYVLLLATTFLYPAGDIVSSMSGRPAVRPRFVSGRYLGLFLYCIHTSLGGVDVPFGVMTFDLIFYLRFGAIMDGGWYCV